MVQFVSQNAFNPLSLNLDDLYIVNVPPPSFIQGAPTDIGGLVGTASWGPVNQPVTIGSPQQLGQVFGPVGTPALSDIHDLVSDAQLAILQAQGLGSTMSLVCVRVTDGTDTKANITIQDTANHPLLVISSLYTGIFGNQIQVNVTGGAKPGTSNVTISMPGQSGELYQNLTNSTFQQSLISALKSGISGIRGPSQIVSATLPLLSPPVITAPEFTPMTSGGTLSDGAYKILVTALSSNGETTQSNEVTITVAGGGGFGSIAFALPAFAFGQTGYNIYMTQTNGASGTELLDLMNNGPAGTITSVPALTEPAPPTMNTATITNTTAPKVQLYALSGGTDGRNVTSAQLLGSDFNPSTGSQPTGAFALRGQNVSVFAVCGLVDSTVWSSLVPLADSEGMVLVLPFPQGESTTAAIALKNTLGIDDYNVVMVKDWLFFFDQSNNQVRAISPTGVYVGHIASLSPEQNIGNKLVFGIIGTDRLSPTSSQPYTNAELSQLEQNGISLVTNPIPLGKDFGVRHGQNISSNPAEAQVEFARMTNFLDRSFGENMGQYVGQLQSTDPADPLRAAVRNSLNNFLANLLSLGKINAFAVVCDLTNNTPQTIAQHFLYAFVKVQYLSAVRFFVIQLQGGTTVNVSNSSSLAGV